MKAAMLFVLAFAAALQAAAPPAPAPRRGRNLRPSANLGLLFTPDDYPHASRVAREEGRVRFRIEIGADGLVTSCTVIESSGFAALDAAACRIVQLRARYAPATDRRGRPVAGSDRASVVWRLPPPDDELEAADDKLVPPPQHRD